MKKAILLLLGTAILVTAQSNAQVYEIGYPTSLKLNPEPIVSEIILPELNMEEIAAFVKENDAKPNKSYAVGWPVYADISFPNSGTIVNMEDGNRIWKIMIKVPNSKGIMFYFDKFFLPEGVKLFVHNENRKHILGAFTSGNNSDDGYFAIDAIQGNTAYLELNISPNVNIDDIAMNVENLGAMFRGYSDLDQYLDGTEPEFIDIFGSAFGNSSVCAINAICPTASSYADQRKSTVHTVIPNSSGSSYIGNCSGALINSTGKTALNCPIYLLTASHCEGSNAESGSPVYSKYMVRFDYEQATCTRTNIYPAAVKSATNLVLKARSYLPPTTPEMKGDFLLMQMSSLPTGTTTANYKLLGWNSGTVPLSYSGTKRFIAFHHPAGDAKMFSSSKSVLNTAYDWRTEFTEGIGAPGSSGSSFFDNEGRIIGIASTAYTGAAPPDCLVGFDGGDASQSSVIVNYSKIAYNWTNLADAVSGTTEPKRRLNRWLDPIESGVSTMNAESCPTSSIDYNVDMTFGDMLIFPNPSTGLIQIKLVVSNSSNLSLSVTDISGRILSNNRLNNQNDQIINLDLNHLANGVYLVKISNEYGQITKKVVINK